MIPRQIVVILVLFACIAQWLGSGLALLLGVGLSFWIQSGIPPASLKKTQTFLLQASIVGLGAGIDIGQVLRYGSSSIPSTLAVLVLLMGLGYALSKLLQIQSDLGLLISAGTAICGGSAIAALSPVLKSKGEHVTLALGIVFLLNAFALFVFPPLGHLLGMSESSFGSFAALAIHDTSSVVAAASQYGSQALEIATTTKLVRSLWIIPLTLTVGFTARSSSSSIKIPYFIFGFVIMSLIATTVQKTSSDFTPFFNFIAHHSKSVMVFSIFLIGLGFNLKTLKSVGARSILFALSLWSVSIALSYGISAW